MREGKRIRTTNIEVCVAASPLVYSNKQSVQLRIGLIVPRYKHTAVARNTLKRRLRELTRLYLLPTNLRADIVLRTRPETYNASFSELAAEIVQMLKHLEEWCVIEIPDDPTRKIAKSSDVQ